MMGKFLTHNATSVVLFLEDGQIEPLLYWQMSFTELFTEAVILWEDAPFSRNRLIIPGKAVDIEIWQTLQKIFILFGANLSCLVGKYIPKDAWEE